MVFAHSIVATYERIYTYYVLYAYFNLYLPYAYTHVTTQIYEYAIRIYMYMHPLLIFLFFFLMCMHPLLIFMLQHHEGQTNVRRYEMLREHILYNRTHSI